MRRKSSLIGDLFSMDVLLGMLLGIAGTFLILIVMQDVSDKGGNVVYAYQSLIAGILALIGAAFALIAIMHQIRHAQEMEDERRLRRNYSARSVMPHALSSLCAYARECCIALQDAVDENDPPSEHEDIHLSQNWTISAPSDDAMNILRECIEFGNTDIQHYLADLIGRLQIQYSRISNPREVYDDGRIKGSWYYTLVIDAIEIYDRAAMLFDYARREKETAPNQPSLSTMTNAALNCSFDFKYWPNLGEVLESRWN